MNFPASIPWKSKESHELTSFESMKQELLVILKDFLEIVELDIFSLNDEIDIIKYTIPNEAYEEIKNLLPKDFKKLRNENWKIDLMSYLGRDIIDVTSIKIFIATYVKYFVENFISNYSYGSKWRTLLIDWEMYSNVFSKQREMSITEKINNIINLLSHKLFTKIKYDNNKSDFDAQKEKNELESKLNKLREINPNIIWYIILKCLERDIQTSTPGNFDFFTRFLQNNYMFEWNWFWERFDNFFAKNIFTLSIEAQYKILDTKDWEDFLDKLLKKDLYDKNEKLTLLVFVLKYHASKYTKFQERIYIECIKLIKEKAWEIGFLNKIEWVVLEILMDIYWYYQRNKEKLKFDFDVEKAFEEYVILYNEDDFKIFNHDNLWVYNWSLPFVYVKRSIQSHISRISNNILEEKNTREQNEMEIRWVKTKKWLKSRKAKSLKSWKNPTHSLTDRNTLDIWYSFFNWDLPDIFLYRHTDDFNANWMNHLDKDDFEDYYRLKELKVPKDSHDAEILRKHRKNMRMAIDPIVIRQRLYSTIISHLITNPNFKPQYWMSIWEQIRKKENEAKKWLDIQRENELLQRLSNWWREAKLWKTDAEKLHQWWEDARLRLERSQDPNFVDDIPF